MVTTYRRPSAGRQTGIVGADIEEDIMDLIARQLRIDDHRAALEAEAGIERLLRDLRDLDATQGRSPSRPRAIRAAVGRALIAIGGALAAAPATDDPCRDSAGGAAA